MRVRGWGDEGIATAEIFLLLAQRGLGLVGEGAHEGQVAVALGEVEAVAHDEVGGDAKARVGHVEVVGLVVVGDRQRAHGQAGRLPGEQVAAQVRQGEVTVDDVLHQQDMALGEVEVEVLDDADHAAGAVVLP